MFVQELLTELLKDPTAVAGLLGATLVPFVTEVLKVIKKEGLRRTVAWFVSLGSSVGVALATLYVQDGALVWGDQTLKTIGVTFLAAQGIYELVWKPRKLDEKLEAKALKLFRR